MSVVLAGAAAPSVGSCPGLVNLTLVSLDCRRGMGKVRYVELLVIVSPVAMMMMQI